ncbi:TonB family protein [Bacteroidota bacterium]
MSSMILYFIKSAIAMALFYGVYRVFMEKETNYSLNRFYLVGTIFLSLILPVLPLENLFVFGSSRMPVFFITGEEDIVLPMIEVSRASGGGFNINGLFLTGIIYKTGIGLLAATLFIQLFRLLFIKRVGKESYGPLKIISVSNSILPFSILNRVYISHESLKDPKINTILDHEYAHFRYLHFIDLILLEFITIFQWFNPIAWLYVRSLKEIHEYQADAAVLRRGEATGSYQALLVNQLTGTEVFRLSSAFSKSLTKKRMIMMTKIKSRKSAWMKALLAMPVLAILLVAYAANTPATVTGNGDYVVKGKVVEDETGEPIPGVNIIWESGGTGTITDINGEFSLNVEDKNVVLVYSFVGLKTARTEGIGTFTVRMGTNVFEITGEYDPDIYKNQDEPPVKEPYKNLTKDPDANKKGEEEEVFFVVEDLPRFQNKHFNACRDWIQENVVYPEEAKSKGITGKVYVQFIVSAKGEVKKAKVVRGVDPLLDKAALDVINSMTDWTPGKQRGKSVSVQFIIPVQFGD